MAAILTDEAQLEALVRTMRRIAVLGIKDGANDPDAPAYSIPAMLAESGRTVIGINPKVASALGRATLASLRDLDEAVDVLDVFRRSDTLPQHADELIALPLERRPRTVWFQSGIRNDAVAQRLVAAGMNVVQDRCLGVYTRRYR